MVYFALFVSKTAVHDVDWIDGTSTGADLPVAAVLRLR